VGYDLHITRRENWSDTTGPAITEAEWRAAIESDPELTLDTQTRCTMADGEYIFAAWNGRAGELGYFGGEITAKNPDPALVRKMVQLAQVLGAAVQGDDGESYGEDGNPVGSSAPAPRGLLSIFRGWFQRRST
jgi:hypothetical protein